MRIQDDKVRMAKLLKLAPKVAEILFAPAEHRRLKVGSKSYPIKGFRNGAVRAVDLGTYRFMTQSPLKQSAWGQMARQGHQILWVVHQPSDAWLVRVVDGEPEVLRDRR